MKSLISKCLTIGIILLFLGVSITPSINQSIVTASQEDDLIEVTSQACGIKGYGNNTIKLTREQYNSLDLYLVEFRARLNQTSTREEATPIFNDAVVELDKYGLLPNGMSVEEAKKLIINPYRDDKKIRIKDIFFEDYFPYSCNALCLLAGKTTRTSFIPFITRAGILLILSSGALLYGAPKIADLLIGLLFLVSYILPFTFLSWICFGEFHSRPSGHIEPAYGWVSTIGLNGVKSWDGYFAGAFMTLGAFGFTGIKLFIDDEFTYLGSALLVTMEMGWKDTI